MEPRSYLRVGIKLVMTTTMTLLNQIQGDDAISKHINVQFAATQTFIQLDTSTANHIAEDVSLLRMKKLSTNHHTQRKHPFIFHMSYHQNRKNYQINL